MMVAPTEPPALRAIATKVTMYPEAFGCDVMWRSRGRWVGVQRKEMADLIASVSDGRLGQQVAQMQPLIEQGGVCVVVVEGEPRWTLEGEMIGGWGRGLTEAQWRGVLWSVQSRGVWVDRTRDLTATIEWIGSFKAWCAKDRHGSLNKRTGPVNMWGKPTNADFQRHMLMGLPGVGAELADRLIAKYGMPLRWTVTREELMQVEGVGAKKADAMLKALGGA